MTSKYDPIPDGERALDYFRPSVAPSPFDPRDFAAALRLPLAPVPPMVRHFRLPRRPIRNQGPWGSCAIFSGVRTLEHALLGAGLDWDMAEEFVYALVRQREGTLGQNEGTYPRDVMAVLCDVGDVAEADDPYLSHDLSWAPDTALIAKVIAKGSEYVKGGSPAEVKAMLYAGYAVMACFELRQNFEPGPGGLIPMPAGGIWGGHAMTFVGWNDDAGTAGGEGGWIVENSWSDGWGAAGACVIPYAMANLPENQGGCWWSETYSVHVPAAPQPEPPPPPDDWRVLAHSAIGRARAVFQDMPPRSTTRRFALQALARADVEVNRQS